MAGLESQSKGAHCSDGASDCNPHQLPSPVHRIAVAVMCGTMICGAEICGAEMAAC